MIREFHNQDIESIMKLWLETNILTHAFIKADYWENNYNSVKNSIHSANIYVYEDIAILGFIGLVDHYIAGIFVSQQVQSNGIGQELLDYVKNKNDKLFLNVYKKNQRAVNFYLREGFSISNIQTDKNTGEVELSMDWVKLKP